MFETYFLMGAKPTIELIANTVNRMAADLESEKRTRADANKAVLDELKGLRKDMNEYFHGDGEQDNPGILIRLDRLEQTQASRKSQMNWLWGIIGTVAAAFIWKIFYDFLIYYPQIAQ